MEPKFSCGKRCTTWKCLCQFHSWKPAIKFRPNYHPSLTPILIAKFWSCSFFKAVLPWDGWHNHPYLEAEKHCAFTHKISTEVVVQWQRYLLQYLDSLLQENFLSSSPGTVLILCWQNVQREMLFSSGVVLYWVALNLWSTRPYTIDLIWPLSSVSIFIILVFSMVSVVIAVKLYLI